MNKKRICIYGTGGNGIKVYHVLKDKYAVEGFIDKRASEIGRIEGEAVWSLEDFNVEKDCIIIITVKNIFLHDEIVRELIKRGYHYFIFKAGNVLKGNTSEREKIVDDLYETIVEKKCLPNIMEVPKTERIEYRFDNKLLICKGESAVKAWCPIELLFNYENSNDYSGLNMPLFFPLIDLFRFFLGQYGASVDQCKDAVGNFLLYAGEWLYNNGREMTETQMNSFLESRRSIFEQMQKMVEVDIDFFKRNCVNVVYKGKKFFMVSSGRNRVCFLIAKGFKYVPVEMSYDDYEKWCDMEYVKEVEREINDKDINTFFALHTNPYLADFRTEFNDYQRLFLIPAATYIYKKVFSENVINLKGKIQRFDYMKALCQIRESVFRVLANDGNIANEYFESIEFSIAACTSDAKYLLVNSVNIENEEQTYKEISNFEGEIAFCMEYENGEVDKILDGKNFRLESILFRSYYRNRMIYGAIYKR